MPVKAPAIARYELLAPKDEAGKWYVLDTKTGRLLCYGSKKLCQALITHLNYIEWESRRSGIEPE